MRRTRWGALALVLGIALVSAACGGNGGTAGAGGEQAAAASTTLAVSLSDFKITPAAFNAPTGAPIAFTVTNDGQTAHTLAVEAGDQTFETPQIAAGESATLEVPALAAGTYAMLCTIPGHADLGMKATLTVAEGAGTTAAAGSESMPGMSSPMPSMTADEMASSHEKGVNDFVGQLENGPLTDTAGNQPLKPEMDGKVKVFTLVASQVRWEVAPGQFVDAMAFNGQVPGPKIEVRYGDRVRIVVQNQMTQPTTLHLHGMTLPNDQDGVPFVTQKPIMPGGYWTYEFTVQDPPGMYVYHSHFNSTEQVGSGLYGCLMVEPAGGTWPYRALNVDPKTGFSTVGSTVAVDDEYTLFLGDGPLGYVLNGKSFPATEPIVAHTGDWVLIHLANDGSMLHPMHMHGYHFEVVAQDGFPLEQPYMADTLVIAPGQRFDVLVHAVYPGAWAFHCHILPHVEGPQGMYGMVTALVVV
jgi:FtsP/CotA-like multicopper oxidase with cupredoxin domain